MKNLNQVAFAVTLLFVTPALAADNTATTTNSEQMFKECDSNQDGKISKEEYQKEKMEKFSRFDKNNDGSLSKDEHQQMATSMRNKVTNETRGMLGRDDDQQQNRNR